MRAAPLTPFLAMPAVLTSNTSDRGIFARVRAHGEDPSYWLRDPGMFWMRLPHAYYGHVGGMRERIRVKFACFVEGRTGARMLTLTQLSLSPSGEIVAEREPNDADAERIAEAFGFVGSLAGWKRWAGQDHIEEGTHLAQLFEFNAR